MEFFLKIYKITLSVITKSSLIAVIFIATWHLYGSDHASITIDNETPYCSSAIHPADPTSEDHNSSYHQWLAGISKNAKKLSLPSQLSFAMKANATTPSTLEFAQKIENSMGSIQSLWLPSSENISFHDKLGQGEFSPLTIQIELNNKPMALKIYHNVFKLKDFAPSTVIQNQLAEHDISPPVTGLISSDVLYSLIETSNNPHIKELINIFTKESPPSFGVIMDYFDGAVFAKEKHIAFKDSFEIQLINIEKVLSNYNIMLDDPEVLIDANGKIQIIDLDLSYYISPGGIIKHGYWAQSGEKSLTEVLRDSNFKDYYIPRGSDHFSINVLGKYSANLRFIRQELNLW